VTHCYDPRSLVELHWVEEVVFAMWRQKRLRRVSAAIFASVKFPFPEALLDDPIIDAHVPPTLGRELAAMARYRARIDKDLDQAMAILDRFQRARLAEEQAARQALMQNEPERRAPSPAPAARPEARPAAQHAAQNEPEPAAAPSPQAPPQSPMNRQQRRHQERQAQKRHRRAG
jgi:hypothetical protein